MNETLTDFFQSYYKPNRLLGKSKNTDRLYQLSIRSFGKTVGTIATLGHLTDSNIARHMQRVVDDGRSPATANKDRAQLCAMWRYASKVKMVDSWPTIGTLTEPERTPRAWMPNEVSSLFAAIELEEGYFGEVSRERLPSKSSSLFFRVKLPVDIGKCRPVVKRLRLSDLSHRALGDGIRSSYRDDVNASIASDNPSIVG